MSSRMDEGILPKPRNNGRFFDFSDVKDGVSLWLGDNNARIAALNAFKRWNKANGGGFTVKSQKVGDDDPRGSGYRVFFFEVKKAPRANAKKEIYRGLAEMNPLTRQVLSMGQINDDEALLEAMRSTGLDLTTVAGSKKAQQLAHDFSTPWHKARGIAPRQVATDADLAQPEPGYKITSNGLKIPLEYDPEQDDFEGDDIEPEGF